MAGPRVRKTREEGDLEHDASTNESPGARIRSIIERVERLTEEKKAIASDIAQIFAESKGSGFDNKIIKALIKRRAMDAAERAEQDALLHTYSKAIGMASPADAETDE